MYFKTSSRGRNLKRSFFITYKLYNRLHEFTMVAQEGQSWFWKQKQRNLNCEIKQNLSYEIKQNLSLEKKTESLFRNKTEFQFWNKIGSDFRNKTESHFQNKTESHFRKKIGSHFSVHIWMNIFKPKLKRLFALRHSYKKHAFLMLTQSMLTSRQTCTINYIWLIFLWHLQFFTDFLLG